MGDPAGAALSWRGFALGAGLGLLVCVGAGVLLGWTFWGQMLLLQLGVPVIPQWPSGGEITDSMHGGEETVMLNNLLSTSSPSIDSESAQYRQAVVRVAADFNAVETALSVDLAPPLAEIGVRSQSGNFDGIVTVLADAADAITHTQQLVTRFGEAIDALSAAEVSEQFKAHTGAVVVAGKALEASMTSHLANTQALVSGRVPTKKDIDAFIASSEESARARAALRASMLVLYGN